MSMKSLIQDWLEIQPAQKSSMVIQESISYEANVMRNRILYRGDPSEIEQFFKQATEGSAIAGDTVGQARFWAAVPTEGMQIRKIHSGLPGMIVNTLSKVTVSDMLDIEITKPASYKEKWESLARENDLKELIQESIQEVLHVGDGAFKISYDPAVSMFPILEFYSGERVEYTICRGRVTEIIFIDKYEKGSACYTLREIRGMGYIKYELLGANGKPVDLMELQETMDLKNMTYDRKYIAAVRFIIDKSPKWQGRGRSIYDLKVDAFDALDETISQWQDALRLGRIKRYIPSSLVPYNVATGQALVPSPFDNQFIAVRGLMGEGAKQEITTEQPKIDFNGMLATYINNLDLCLQGLISPSTLGIDVKKLDNAEAQREKEKTTLYTRGQIISVLQKVIEELVEATVYFMADLEKQDCGEVECEVGFGEYANPSFEAQVETVCKAKIGGVMSTEAAVDILYGDTKEDDWKEEEVARILIETGVATVPDPSMTPPGSFIPETPSPLPSETSPVTEAPVIPLVVPPIEEVKESV